MFWWESHLPRPTHSGQSSLPRPCGVVCARMAVQMCVGTHMAVGSCGRATLTLAPKMRRPRGKVLPVCPWQGLPRRTEASPSPQGGDRPRCQNATKAGALPGPTLTPGNSLRSAFKGLFCMDLQRPRRALKGPSERQARRAVGKGTWKFRVQTRGREEKQLASGL